MVHAALICTIQNMNTRQSVFSVELVFKKELKYLAKCKLTSSQSAVGFVAKEALIPFLPIL